MNEKTGTSEAEKEDLSGIAFVCGLFGFVLGAALGAVVIEFVAFDGLRRREIVPRQFETAEPEPATLADIVAIFERNNPDITLGEYVELLKTYPPEWLNAPLVSTQRTVEAQGRKENEK